LMAGMSGGAGREVPPPISAPPPPIVPLVLPSKGSRFAMTPPGYTLAIIMPVGEKEFA
jgi:hypothetical protein